MSERTSIVLVFVGWLLSVAGAHASCPIELSPPSTVVRYGDPVSINCSTSESQFEGIGWEATKGRKNLQKVDHLIWTLEKVTDWSISPLCFFNPLNEDNSTEQCLIAPKIVVYTFPETINIDFNSTLEGAVIENGNCSFRCDIPNIAPIQNLTVRWYKGDDLFHTETFNNTSDKPVNQSSLLWFTAKRQDNNVAFRCEAHLDLGELQLNVSSPQYNITVYYGPEVQCSTSEFLEGQTLKEKCPVTGNPNPFVDWLKGGQPVDPTLPLSRNESGQYIIKAEGANYIKHELQVVVLYGPELTCPTNHTTHEYSPNTLTCIVKGYPKPEIIWYKDGEEVELQENLTRSDAGQYVVTASNKIASVNTSVDISVLYPPSPVVELEDTEVDVGSSVWLKCSSVGNPRPQYSWDYYYTDNVKSTSEDGVSRLLILNSTAYNGGLYTCQAWNEIGNVSKTARVTVKGAKLECPVEITPDRMVIQYQGTNRNALCKPISDQFSNVREIHWKDQRGLTTSTTWSANTQEDWDPQPLCTANVKGIGTCHKKLDFTLYKTPDSVSIIAVGNRSSVVENRKFQLRCDVTNVAPAGNLEVRWYRGNETVEPQEGSMQVTGCLLDNTHCDINVTRSPLNVSSVISITLNRTQNGAQFRCEARLDLGPEGPQPPPNMMSDTLNISVYYKPVINTAKLAKRVPVFRGYPEELICEADGHPPPKIAWLYSPDNQPHVSGEMLIVSEAGIYNCTATNEVDSMSYEVAVILKEDYLPLIAGFVAVTVVVISIIFLFIYSIYYKNTKMRRYSLKNPRLNTHNGNVAHNGWDLQLPMTKLS